MLQGVVNGMPAADWLPALDTDCLLAEDPLLLMMTVVVITEKNRVVVVIQLLRLYQFLLMQLMGLLYFWASRILKKRTEILKSIKKF